MTALRKTLFARGAYIKLEETPATSELFPKGLPKSRGGHVHNHLSHVYNAALRVPHTDALYPFIMSACFV